MEIQLPALRDRREDISLFAMHFLGQYSKKYRKQLTDFDAAAMKTLLKHSWPGNVRELDHVVERAVIMAQGVTLRAGDLGLHSNSEGSLLVEEMSLEEVERLLVKKALMGANGNVSEAAQTLGLSRSALYRRIEKYSL